MEMHSNDFTDYKGRKNLVKFGVLLKHPVHRAHTHFEERFVVAQIHFSTSNHTVPGLHLSIKALLVLQAALDIH